MSSDSSESKDQQPVAGKLFGTLLRETSNEVDQQAKQVTSIQEFERPPIPDSFDGRVTWKAYLSPILDQQDCAGCYAFATNGCLADKFALQTLLQVKPVFDPLETVMCLIEAKDAADYRQLRENIDALQQEEKTHLSTACKGNTIYAAARYLYRWGAVEDSCIPLKSLQDMMKKTGNLPVCTTVEGPGIDLCLDNKVAQRAWPILTYYTLEGEGEELVKAIQLDVLKWGPITVAFRVYPDFLKYDGKSIYVPTPGQTSLGGHAVKLLGWGQQDNIPYWVCANSWGTQWGEEGYFKIARLNPMLALEENHAGLYPQLPGITTTIPFSKLVSKITKEDTAERAYNDIDPVTFYPQKLIPLIKNGTLKGDLRPAINQAGLPASFNFFAYLINITPFRAATTDGVVRAPTYVPDKSYCHCGNKKEGMGWYLLLGAIILILGFLALWLWRRCKRG